MSDETQEGKNEIKPLPANLALLRREFSEKTGLSNDEITEEQLKDFKDILDKGKSQENKYAYLGYLVYFFISILLLLLTMKTCSNISNTSNDTVKPSTISVNFVNKNNSLSKDSVEIVTSKLESISERINDRFEAYDKKYEAFNQSIGTDISTLEMMLSIMTIFLGLFAFIGINSFRENRKEMEEEIVKSEKKLEKLQQRMEQYEYLHVEYEDFLIKYRREKAKLDADLDRKDSRIKNCKEIINEQSEKLINPMHYRAELDYMYNYELFEKTKLSDDDKFHLGLYHIVNGNNIKAIESLMKLSIPIHKFYYAIAVDDSGNYMEAKVQYEKLIKALENDTIKCSIVKSNLGFTIIELMKIGKANTTDIKKAREYFQNRIINTDDNDEIIAIYGQLIIDYLENKIYDNKNKILKDSKNLKYIQKTSDYEYFYSKKQLERTFEKINEIHSKYC
jgi:hypothetical protein